MKLGGCEMMEKCVAAQKCLIFFFLLFLNLCFFLCEIFNHFTSLGLEQYLISFIHSFKFIHLRGAEGNSLFGGAASNSSEHTENLNMKRNEKVLYKCNSVKTQIFPCEML